MQTDSEFLNDPLEVHTYFYLWYYEYYNIIYNIYYLQYYNLNKCKRHKI